MSGGYRARSAEAPCLLQTATVVRRTKPQTPASLLQMVLAPRAVPHQMTECGRRGVAWIGSGQLTTKATLRALIVLAFPVARNARCPFLPVL